MSRAAVPLPADRTDLYLRKREAFLAAAATVFNRKGLKGATLADVTEIVGLSANAITYYYRFKEELAVDCYLRTIDRLEALVVDAQDERDTAARIRHFLTGWFALLADIREGRHEDLINFYDIASLSRANFVKVREPFLRLAQHIRRIVQAPDVSPARAARHARAHLLLSLTYGARNWAVRYEVTDYPRVAARMADILLNGIFGPGAGPLPPSAVAIVADRGGRGNSRESFLRAATALINAQGYRGASVDKIAASLSVTKGSFYHHIDAKDDLVAGCFTRSFGIVRDTLRRAAARLPASGERLLWSVTALVRHQLSADGPLLRYTALSAMPEALRPEVKQAGERLTESFAGLTSDAIAEGAIRPLDAAIAAHLIDTMINAAAELPTWTPCLTVEERLDAYMRPIVEGFAAP